MTKRFSFSKAACAPQPVGAGRLPILAGLLMLTLLAGCSTHRGITILKRAQAADKSLAASQPPPEFQVAAGDVVRIEASFLQQGTAPWRLEIGNILDIAFTFAAGDYVLMSGDEIQVNFQADAGLDFKATVRPDGHITIPRLGDLAAAGIKPSELAAAIATSLKPQLKNSFNTVSVARSNTAPLDSMSGEYTVLPDGTVSLPNLGRIAVVGLTVEDLATVLAGKAYAAFGNHFQVAIIPRNLPAENQPFLATNLTVDPTGKILLPGHGLLPVAGLTLSAIRPRIRETLQSLYQNPLDVAISLVSSPNQVVYVSGEVRRAGQYPLTPDLTLLKVIMQAGGLTPEGNFDEIVLIHHASRDDIVIYKTNLAEVLEQGKGAQDMVLSPQDLIYVPKTGIAKANQFIDQYVTRMLPFSRSVNYNYNQNPDLSK